MSRPTTTPAERSAPPISTAKSDPAAQSPTEAQIVSLCRTTVGDSLRSVVHFTREESELLYLRADLYGEDRRRTLEVKATIVESERVGFSASEGYEPHTRGEVRDPERGDYEFTVRVFADGYVCRVIVGDHGLLLTAEDVELDRIEEVAVALRGLVGAAYASGE